MNRQLARVIEDKKILAVVIAFFLLLAYFGWQYFSNSFLPDEFQDARQVSAEISSQIVELTSTTNNKIKDINYSDWNGDYAKALELVRQAKEDNKNAFNQAVELSNKLKVMAEAIPEIRSAEKRQIAQEAVAIELSIITHFINYNKSIEDLLVVLENRFLTSTEKYERDIDIKLYEINTLAAGINNMNQQFNERMTKLDGKL